MPTPGPHAPDPRRPARPGRRPPRQADPFAPQPDPFANANSSAGGEPTDAGSAGDSHFDLDSLPDLTQQEGRRPAPVPKPTPRPTPRPAPRQPAAADARAGSTAGASGAYKLLHKLGGGGMGEVWVAQQHRPRRRVAIKLIRPDMAGGASGTIERRFELEAEALARLQHEGIAQIYDAGYDKRRKRPYYVMELVEGRQLNRWAAEDAPNLGRRLRVIIKLCEAIAHAHVRGVIHRDLKPANVIVTDEGRPKILDFGLARMADSDDHRPTVATQPGQLLGTLAYMSPEQADGDIDKLDGRTDIYSVGVIAYELLTGNLPIDVRGKTHYGAIKAIMETSPPSLVGQDSHFNDDLDTIVRRALSKRREGRYNGAGEMAAALRHWRDVHLAPGGGPSMNVAPSGGFANSIKSAFTAFSSRGPDTSTVAERAARAAGRRRGRTLLASAFALLLLLVAVVAGVWFDLLPGRDRLVALLDRAGVALPDEERPDLPPDLPPDTVPNDPPQADPLPKPYQSGGPANVERAAVERAAGEAQRAGERLERLAPRYRWDVDQSTIDRSTAAPDQMVVQAYNRQAAALDALADRYQVARDALGTRPPAEGAQRLRFNAVNIALATALDEVEAGDYESAEPAQEAVDALLAWDDADLAAVDAARDGALAAETALSDLRAGGLDELFDDEVNADAETVADVRATIEQGLADNADPRLAIERYESIRATLSARARGLASRAGVLASAREAVSKLPAGRTKDAFDERLKEAAAAYDVGDREAATSSWREIAGDAAGALAAARAEYEAEQKLAAAWAAVEAELERARQGQSAFAEELKVELAPLAADSPRRLASGGLPEALGAGLARVAALAEAERDAAEAGDAAAVAGTVENVNRATARLLEWAQARRQMAQTLDALGLAVPAADADWMASPNDLLRLALDAGERAQLAREAEWVGVTNALTAAADEARAARDAFVDAGGPADAPQLATVPDESAVDAAVRDRLLAKQTEWSSLAAELRGLADRRAQVNAADPVTGRSQLHAAALLPGREGVAAVEQLLAAGAEPRPLDRDRRTPFGLALEANNLAVARVLAERSGLPERLTENRESIIVLAHTAEAIAFVTELEGFGGVGRMRFTRGRTALHRLVENANFADLGPAEQEAAVRELVARGIDAAATDDGGHTAGFYVGQRIGEGDKGKAARRLAAILAELERASRR